ncbi:uncharacterized protein [Onthophagus taurus]|uniref:uncharacterized protein n=1 Tax=Onthophagus taurus TaxID=166361 RepID=UPI0039BE20A7
MSTKKLNIYREPITDNSIAREEVHSYHPSTNSFENNDVFIIELNQEDVLFSFFESYLRIEGNFTKTLGDPANDVIQLTHNLPTFLFEYIAFEHNGTEIERVREPGLTSLIRTLLQLNDVECKTLEIAGLKWPPEGDLPTVDANNNFMFQIPLSHIFGLFRDYNHIMRGRFKFRFVRSRTDSNCYKATSNVKTKPSSAKFAIKTVTLLAKHVYPSPTIKMKLLDGLNKNSNILVPFRKWSFYELPSMRKGNKEIWSVTSTSNRGRPQYVIVGFQTKRKDHVASDCTFFDHLNIVDLKVYLNSYCYPFESMNLNFAKENYVELYKMYTEFQPYIWESSRKQPLMDFKSFKERSLFVVDATKNNDEEAAPSTSCEVRIEIQSDMDFPPDTKAYCLLIQESMYAYKPLSGEVSIIIN